MTLLEVVFLEIVVGAVFSLVIVTALPAAAVIARLPEVVVMVLSSVTATVILPMSAPSAVAVPAIVAGPSTSSP